MSVCLVATCDRYAACGFSSLSVSVIHVSTSVQTVITEKLTGFQLTNKPLHCMQPELSFSIYNTEKQNQVKLILGILM